MSWVVRPGGLCMTPYRNPIRSLIQVVTSDEGEGLRGLRTRSVRAAGGFVQTAFSETEPLDALSATTALKLLPPTPILDRGAS
jgi:hypothetical protein